MSGVITATLCAGLVFSSLGASAAPLTIDDAAALALIDQPLLVGQQAQIDAAQAGAAPAAQLPDPKLRIGITDVPVTSAPGVQAFNVTQDFSTARRLTLTQDFPREEKRQLGADRARIETEQAASELDNLKRSIRRDARLAWLGAYYPRRAATLTAEVLRFYEQQYDAARIAHSAGRIALHEIIRAQVEIGLQRDRQVDFEGQAGKAVAELRRWIGVAAERELGGEFPIAQPLPALAAMHGRVHEHPQLTAATREIALADNAIAQARAAYKPDWSIEFGYAKRGPAFADMVSVQVGIDLPVFPAQRQDRRLAVQQSLRAKHVQTHETHRRMLAAELDSAHAEWGSALERIGRFERDVLPHASLRSAAALASYQGGKTDLVAVLEARRAELDLQLQWLSLRVAAARARIQLEYLGMQE